MNNKLIPEFRFPEFQNDGDWVKTKIEDFANSFSGLSGKSGNDFGQGSPYISYKQVYNEKIIDFSECSLVSVNSDESQNKVQFGDILITTSSETPGEVGFSNVVLESPQKDTYLNSFCFGIRPNREGFLNVLFSNYLFKTSEYRVLVTQLAQGVTRYNISKNKFLGLKLSIPSKTDEQQKIASCLSSLDEVITLHEQKLTALEDHKKGLMQNLFPQEGETQPKYRFPEFVNDGDWVEKNIQTLIDENIIVSHLDGNHGALYPRAEEFTSEGVPYITANDFISGVVDFTSCKHLPLHHAKKFKKGVAKNGDILFAHNATVGPVAKLVTDSSFVILSTTATYFRCDNVLLINDFLKFALSCPFFVNQYVRVMSQSTRNQVPITTQRKFNLQLPEPKEQQKIADCLSSVDELITEQRNKIKQLKEHKKGLMQNLFPKIES